MKSISKKNPTYIECSVCEEWLNFQNFARWCNENFYTCDNEKMDLDKDILIKGNKIYSQETCIFVPHRINSLFTKGGKVRGLYPIGVYFHKISNKYQSQGRDLNGKRINLGLFENSIDAFNKYKIFKEKIIQQIADEYKDQIPEKLYKALYDYRVEIGD